MIGEEDTNQSENVFEIFSRFVPVSILPIPEIHNDLFKASKTSAFDEFIEAEKYEGNEEEDSKLMASLETLLQSIKLSHLDFTDGVQTDALHEFPILSNCMNAGRFVDSQTSPSPSPLMTTAAPPTPVSEKSPIISANVPSKKVKSSKDKKKQETAVASMDMNVIMEMASHGAFETLNEAQMSSLLSLDQVADECIQAALSSSSASPQAAIIALKFAPQATLLLMVKDFTTTIFNHLPHATWGLKLAHMWRRWISSFILDVPDAISLFNCTIQAIKRLPGPQLSSPTYQDLLYALTWFCYCHDDVWTHAKESLLMADGPSSSSNTPIECLIAADLMLALFVFSLGKQESPLDESSLSNLVDFKVAVNVPSCGAKLIASCVEIIKSEGHVYPLIPLRSLFGHLLKGSMRKDLKMEDRVSAVDLCGRIAGCLRFLGKTEDVPAAYEAPASSRFEDLADLHRVNERCYGALQVGDHSWPAISAMVKDKKNPLNPERFSALLVQLCSDPNLHLRVRALKELHSLVVEGDPLSENASFVNSLLAKKLEDPSSSVREVAADILSLYLTKESFKADCLTALMAKLTDPSVAVRKRIVKALSDTLPLLSGPKVESDAAELRSALISQAGGDYKGTSTMAMEMLLGKWLTPLSLRREDACRQGDASSVRQMMAAFTADVIRVIRSSSFDKKAFKSFFTKALAAHDGLRIICKHVIDLLLETLVTSLEEDSDAAVKFILAALVIVLGGGAEDLVGLAEHFRLFCALLSSDDSETVENCLQLMGLCIKKDNQLHRLVPEVISNLFKLAFRGSETIVKASLELLFAFARSSQTILQQLVSMQRKLFAFVQAKCMENNIAEELVPSLSRAVYSLGVLQRLFLEEQKEPSARCPFLTTDDVASSLQLVMNQHETVDVFGCMGAAELLVASPLETLKEPLLTIIKSGLLHSNFMARLVLLAGFHECLAKDKSLIQSSSFNDGVQAKMDYSSSLCTVFQAFSEEIMSSGLIDSSEVVMSSSLLLVAMIKKGLCHPQMLVPALLALNNCPWPAISGRINEICLEVIDQYESYSLITVSKTCPLHFAAQKVWNPTGCRGYIPEDEERESVFKYLYDAFPNAKSKRHDVLSSLLRELESSVNDPSYCRFIAEAIYDLPFKLLEEVLFVLKRTADMLIVSGLDGEVEDGCDSDRSLLVWDLIISRLKGSLALSYRINSEDLESVTTQKGKRELACKRTSNLDLNLNGIEEATISQLIELRENAIQIETVVNRKRTDKSEKPNRPGKQQAKRPAKRRKRNTSGMDMCVSEDEEVTESSSEEEDCFI